MWLDRFLIYFDYTDTNAAISENACYFKLLSSALFNPNDFIHQRIFMSVDEYYLQGKRTKFRKNFHKSLCSMLYKAAQG